MKIIKRKKTPVTESFVAGFKEEKQDKEIEEDKILDKISKSKYWPIVESFYVINPVKKGTKDFWKTKSFNTSIIALRRVMRGTLFNESEFLVYKNRKFTIEEILSSIEIHKLALSPEYKPVDKKYLKVSLEQFLFSPYSQSIGKSYFLYWMNNFPIMNIPLVEDMYPEVTQAIISLFEFKNLDTREKNQITKGVSLFESLLEKVKISPVHRPTPKIHAQIFHDIIAGVFSFVGVEILPRNFISPKMESWIVKGLKDSPYIV